MMGGCATRRIGWTRSLPPSYHGDRLKFVHFWNERRQSGSVGVEVLSQFWQVPIEIEGTTYHSAEQWMMACKARCFNDEAGLAAVMQAKTAAQAKAAGRSVQGYVDEQWATVRYDIVVTGNLAKFSQHDDLRVFLHSTRDRILVEASPMDRVWGIGLAGDKPRATTPSRRRGQNLLGFALMEVREQLAATSR